jgi:hypothetical protein
LAEGGGAELGSTTGGGAAATTAVSTTGVPVALAGGSGLASWVRTASPTPITPTTTIKKPTARSADSPVRRSPVPVLRLVVALANCAPVGSPEGAGVAAGIGS